MRLNIEEEQLSKIDFNFDYNLELKNKNLDNFIKLSFKLQIKNKLNTYDYLMLENSFPLPVKAAGGVRTYEEAVEMIQLGVKRIGTSAAKAIVTGEISNSDY